MNPDLNIIRLRDPTEALFVMDLFVRWYTDPVAGSAGYNDARFRTKEGLEGNGFLTNDRFLITGLVLPCETPMDLFLPRAKAVLGQIGIMGLSPSQYALREVLTKHGLIQVRLKINGGRPKRGTWSWTKAK